METIKATGWYITVGDDRKEFCIPVGAGNYREIILEKQKSMQDQGYDLISSYASSSFDLPDGETLFCNMVFAKKDTWNLTLKI